MRFYERKNGKIELVDFSSPQLFNGNLIIKVNNNTQLTYHVCILCNNEIRLYDIQTTNHILSLSSHYQTYSKKNGTFLRLGKTERIQFSIPNDYSLTPQEHDILLLIDRVQNLKHEINYDSTDDSFFNLMIETYHEYTLTFIETALKTLNLNQLKNALAIHWDNIKGNALRYTSLPNDDITILLCDIAKFLAPRLNNTAISLLMPTVSTESQFADFPDLTTIDIQIILGTHILSTNGDYLIPVSLLLKRKAKTDAENDYPLFEIATIDINKLMSPYYQYDLHGDQAYLDITTVERLFAYCPETEVIFEAIKQHQEFMQDNQNLLGQLMRLTHLLKQNSANGLGEEFEAGKNGFVAITAFFEYYNQLTSAQQSIIPEEIKHIIEKILRYGTEPTRLDDGSIVDRATEIDTCIASISDNLFAAISKANNQKTLSNISISKQKKGKLLRQLEMQFQHGQMDLNKKIQSNSSNGHDSLNITPGVLTLLSLEDKFSIESEDELQQFMKLSPDEISMICVEIPHIKYKITNIIENTENLVFFIFEQGDEKISKLLRAISSALYDINIGILIQPKDFSLVLGPLENGKFNILLSIFLNRLHTIITTLPDLLELVTPLNINQRSIVYENLINILPNLVEDIHDFNYLAKQLNANCLTQFYESTKHHLAHLIKNANHFRQITQHLNTAQCTDFYQLTKIKLPIFIRYACDFEQLTSNLNDTQRCEIFDKIQPRLLWLITEAFDFNYLAKNLNTEKRTDLFNTVKDSLPHFINTTHNFYLIIEHLNPDQQFFICKKLHLNLLNLIKKSILLNNDEMTKLNQTVEHYLITRFFTIFPSLQQGSIISIQDLIRETTSTSKKRPHLFSNRSNINTALKELGITDHSREITISLLYEKINTYLSEMDNNTTSGPIRRQRGMC